MRIMKEYFNKLFSFGPDRIPVIDIEHAEERFYQRFPEIPWSDFKTALEQGLKVIKNKYHLHPDNYMIVSKSLGIKIPVELRPDRMNPHKLVFALMTALDARQHKFNTHNDQTLMVASIDKFIEIIV